jgi:hypothetical protein
LANHSEIITKMNKSYPKSAHGNMNFNVCSYFMWFGLIMSTNEEYTNVPVIQGLSEDDVRKRLDDYDPFMKTFYLNNLDSKIAEVLWVDWAPCVT